MQTFTLNSKEFNHIKLLVDNSWGRGWGGGGGGGGEVGES